jgi:putative ABC transport system ATP-binding protein
MDSLITLTNVTKTYGTQTALDNVSLRIPAGQITAVMGPSGSGKSTLLNLVAGLDRATSGSISVAGREITGLGEAALARYRRDTIGLVFQFFHLLNNLTVFENVVIAAQLAGMSRKEAVTRGGRLLGDLGIADQAESFPARLSGGQRQRVAIARALINRPPVLLADEPTGALDTVAGRLVLDLLHRIHQRGRTVVMVTHDQAVAREAARLVTMRHGRIIDDCSPDQWRPKLLEGAR